MTRHQKLKDRFINRAGDLRWEDLVALLSGFDFEPKKKGGCSGADGFRFMIPGKPETEFTTCKPHGGSPLKAWQVKAVNDHLRELGLI